MSTLIFFNPLSAWQIEVLPLLACGGGEVGGAGMEPVPTTGKKVVVSKY